jgi:hypothetical protein
MKIVVVLLSLLFLSQTASAALTPQYQNMKDLDVMVSFIKAHPRVMMRLTSIDFTSFTILYGNDCKATFARKSVAKPSGWVGPANPLEFKHATCDLD